MNCFIVDPHFKRASGGPECFQGASFVDHPELQSPGMRFDWNSSSVHKDDEEKSDGGQHVAWANHLGSRRPDGRGQRVGQVRVRDQSDCEDDKEHGELDERAEHHRPTGTQLSVRSTRFRARECDRKSSKDQNEATTQDVATESQWQRKSRQYGNEKWDGEIARERDNWPSQKYPTGLIRDECLLPKRLGDVEIDLKDAWAPATLQTSFDVRNETAHEESP